MIQCMNAGLDIRVGGAELALDLALSSCVALGNLPNFSGPLFAHVFIHSHPESWRRAPVVSPSCKSFCDHSSKNPGALIVGMALRWEASI